MAELTALGALWLAALIVMFFLPLRYMAGFLLFSTVFQAAAVVNAAGKGIMPLLVVEMAFILRWLAGGGALRRWGCLSFNKTARWVALFCGYALFATLFLPVLFQGVFLPGIWFRGLPYPPSSGGLGELVWLDSRNALKVFSVFLHGTVLLIFSSTRGIFTPEQLMVWVKLTAVVSIVIGLWETAFKKGWSPLAFPAAFFYNNSGYTMKGLAGHRTNFTFAEPSYAGGFYASLLPAYLAMGGRRNIGTLLLLLAAFALSMAGTSAVTLAAGILLLLALPSRKRDRARAAGVLVLLAGLLLASGYGALYYDLVTGKLGSFSGRERLAGILYGWQVFTRSFGLGVGMGTVRTFSFITELLASLGIVGLLLYFGLFLQLLRPLYHRRKQPVSRFIVAYALCHFVAQCVALPDITTPTLWLGLFMAACGGNFCPQPSRAGFSPLLPFWRHPDFCTKAEKGASPL